MIEKLRKTFLVYIGVIVFGGVVGLIAGFGAWQIAPEVGGAWWPYIRFVIAAIVTLVVAKLVAVILWITFVARLVKNFAEEFQDDDSSLLDDNSLGHDFGNDPFN